MGSSSKTSSVEDSIRNGASEELEDTVDSGDGNPAVWHESQREAKNWLRSVAIASDEFADVDVLQGEEANNPQASPWRAGEAMNIRWIRTHARPTTVQCSRRAKTQFGAMTVLESSPETMDEEAASTGKGSIPWGDPFLGAVEPKDVWDI
ncbi:hypothetical protein F4824DRAFT_506359 [Ustulina deusta]|nr:hypothetical protein F4824DRAFT_506359 [Ustulina deusta]